MASLPPGSNPARLSFAKVAASAHSRSRVPLSATAIPEAPSISNGREDAAGTNSGTNQSPRFAVEELPITAAKPKRLLQLAPRDSDVLERDPEIAGQVLVHASDGGPAVEQYPVATTAGHAIGLGEENHTQISSSNGSARPSSIDGKSVASGTTFALDEKESLRPDDSASVKAIEDEDTLSQPGSAVLALRGGSDTGARAFRDQLREISVMGSSPRPSGQAPRLSPAGQVVTGTLYAPSPLPGIVAFPCVAPDPAAASLAVLPFPPDEKLLEALNSPRDRLWVLKLEQDVTDFVKDSTEHAFDVPQCNSFYRMLAHRMADYYMLGHTVDNAVSSVRLYKTPNCRIPPRLTSLTNPSTAASTPPPSAPAMKILRRGGEGGSGSGEPGGNGTRAFADGDADSGSDGDKPKAPTTREEREARYEAARLRIMGAARPSEDLAAPKEKDDSRSSSAAGKKKGKKQRSDSTDGFEARSAYNMYSSSVLPSSAMPGPDTTTSTYPSFAEAGSTPYDQPPIYGQHDSYSNAYGTTNPSNTNPYPWLQPSYQTLPPPGPGAGGSSWNQPQQLANHLASDFQQSLSFNQSAGPMSPGPYSPGGSFPGAHQQAQSQASQEHHGWQQPHQMQASYSMSPSFGGSPMPQYRPSSSAGQEGPGQSYPFGLLPNHAQMPGMRPSNPHHPLPGSFNRLQFNPQSQNFIPGYASNQHSGPGSPFSQAMRGAFQPRLLSPNSAAGANYSNQAQMQRQTSAPSQHSFQSSQRPATQEPPNGRASGIIGQGMTHPLPQPVFSPHLSMPYSPAQRLPPNPSRPTSETPTNAQPSSIAKWGAPASLPAKPPPPASESFDMARMGQNLRLPLNPNEAARLAGGGQQFHALPSMVGVRRGDGGAGSLSPRAGQDSR